MPKPFPKEFREDVVRVARNRDPKTTLEEVAKDFGIHATTLTGWLKKADVEEGVKPGMTEDQAAELRELKRRNRLLDIQAVINKRAVFVNAGGQSPRHRAGESAKGVAGRAGRKADRIGDEAGPQRQAWIERPPGYVHSPAD